MRLARLRKLAAHLAVALAFGAMAHGGELPAVAPPLFAAAWLASLAGLGRRARAHLRLLLGGTLSALALSFAGWRAGAFDFVVAAALFAAAVCAYRLLSRRGPADDGLLYLTAMMMLAVGGALSGDLAYGGYFAGFVVSAVFALTLSHLERAAAEADAPPSAVRELAGGRLLSLVGALSVFALVGSVALFFAFPRFTTGFLAPVLGHRRPSVGFSGTFRLGGYGTARDDPRVVARVRIEPDPGVAALERHWRGKVFDRFDGQAWTATGAERHAPARRLALGASGPVTERLQLEILPEGGGPAVFFPSGTAQLANPRRVPPRRMAMTLFFAGDALGNVWVQPPPEMGFAYEVQRAAGEPSAVGRGDDYPEEVRWRYLALPEGLDPRVRELARRWTEGLDDPALKAQAIERELERGYAYTLELPGDQADPMAHFLFERRAGHCEYFASALTLLLRAAGVPARNATGYFGGQRVGPGQYVLRAGDAHAWTEVYYPGLGFVTLDATPPAGRGSTAPSWRERWADLVDRAQTAWLQLVIDYSIREQFEGVSGAARAVSRLLGRLHGGKAPPMLRILLAAAVLAAALGMARRLWRRPGGERPARRAAPRGAREAVALYRALLRRLERRGVRPRPGQTGRELVAELRRARRAEAALADEVVERYLAARYGERPLASGEARRLRRALRAL